MAKNSVVGLLGAVVLTVMAVPAHALDFVNTYPVGSANFLATSNADDSISAMLGNHGIGVGTFQDTYTFRVGFAGIGSGSVSTSASTLFSALDSDFTAVFVNGMAASIFIGEDGLVEFASVTNVPIQADPFVNTIVIEGISRGNGSYGGNATFTPAAAVPELSSWALAFAGFGVIGSAMRTRRRRAARDGTNPMQNTFALLRLAWRRLKRPHSGSSDFDVGAACGLVIVAWQRLETDLQPRARRFRTPLQRLSR